MYPTCTTPLYMCHTHIQHVLYMCHIPVSNMCHTPVSNLNLIVYYQQDLRGTFPNYLFSSVTFTSLVLSWYCLYNLICLQLPPWCMCLGLALKSQMMWCVHWFVLWVNQFDMVTAHLQAVKERDQNYLLCIQFLQHW